MNVRTETVALGVVRVPIVFVNAYLIDAPQGSWVLVDTGLPNSSRYLREAAEERYKEKRPEAIILTHGHFDHAGTALELAETWSVPIYAHPLELPYLTGASDYPPQDPTVGGAIAMMSRAFPHRGYDFGARVQPLPADGSVPGLPGWRTLHTPGHTPGHVSLWRESDRTLIAGDALATMDLDSWTSQLTHRRELSRPPTPFTPDWGAAERSLSRLAELGPLALAAGHGRSLSGSDLAAQLRRFTDDFSPPQRGRYAQSPARTDERGVVALPPPVHDPLPKRIAWGALATALGVAAAAAIRAARRSPDSARYTEGTALAERTALVGDIRMRWLEHGQGQPVVFVHGIPTSPELWREVMPRLGARTLAWEMVGYGKSIPEGSGRDISVAKQADYLTAWLDHLNIERAVLVGHDLGGGVVQNLAVRHSERCVGLLLTNAIGYDSWPIPEVEAIRALGGLIRRLPNSVVKLIHRLLFSLGHDEATEAREALAVHWQHYVHQGAGEAFIRQVRSLNVQDTLDVQSTLPHLNVPARIVWGAADQFQKVRYGERFARDLGTTLQRIEGGKHFTPEDYPEVLAEALSSLLLEIQEISTARRSE